jgi:tetratricopeptide (TPR) repeat protein
MSKIEQLCEFLKENPDDAFINYALALEYLKINNKEKSIELFQLLTIKHCDYLPTYLHYGNLLAEIGNTEQAALTYEKGIDVACSQKNTKAKGELQQALFILD